MVLTKEWRLCFTSTKDTIAEQILGISSLQHSLTISTMGQFSLANFPQFHCLLLPCRLCLSQSPSSFYMVLCPGAFFPPPTFISIFSGLTFHRWIFLTLRSYTASFKTTTFKRNILVLSGHGSSCLSSRDKRKKPILPWEIAPLTVHQQTAAQKILN
jgi:hypothetical protein